MTDPYADIREPWPGKGSERARTYTIIVLLFIAAFLAFAVTRLRSQNESLRTTIAIMAAESERTRTPEQRREVMPTLDTDN